MATLHFAAAGALACLLSTSVGLAQDPAPNNELPAALTASRERLEKALAKTAALRDTKFEAAWGPAKGGRKKGDDPFVAMLGMRGSGEASGSWHERLSVCRFEGDEVDELVTVGRRTIARSDSEDWQIRAGRFADGNTVGYVPDVELLLQLLDDWPLAVIHRDVGSIDDRPVETITVTLNADQVAEAAWSGALPSQLVVGGFGAGVFRFAAGGVGGGRRAAKKPEAIVDLAIALDPATLLVHRISARAYVDEQRGGGMVGGGVFVVRGGVGVAEEEEEEEEAEEIDEQGPMRFEDGLPNRSRRKKVVSDFTVRLSDHGTATAPELSPKQKKLLRL